MEFLNRVTKSTDPNVIIDELTKECKQSYDLGVIFSSHQDPAVIKRSLESLRSRVEIKNLIGCTCAGIISSHNELEYQPGLSLFLAKLPHVKFSPFLMTQSDLENITSKKDLYEFFQIFPNEEPVFLTFPDPFLFDMNAFLALLNDAYPSCPMVGGLASASGSPRGNALLLNDEMIDEGIVGMIMTGDINVKTLVSQGCRPIGQSFIATRAEDNVIYELASRSFLDVLREILEQASAQDKLLAQDALLIGIAIDEYKHQFRRGDFLIRGLMGIDQTTGAGVIGDYIKKGQTVQFHVRDAQSATEDLNELLIEQQNECHHVRPKGALIFSCNGRGEGLFKEKNHDINIIQNHLGPVPAAGFFCAGEIGPVGKKNFLHGFTDSIAFFYPKSPSPKM